LVIKGREIIVLGPCYTATTLILAHSIGNALYSLFWRYVQRTKGITVWSCFSLHWVRKSQGSQRGEHRAAIYIPRNG